MCHGIGTEGTFPVNGLSQKGFQQAGGDCRDAKLTQNSSSCAKTRHSPLPKIVMVADFCQESVSVSLDLRLICPYCFSMGPVMRRYASKCRAGKLGRSAGICQSTTDAYEFARR